MFALSFSLSQVEEHEMETREVRMDFDSKLAEQDFDYVDDEEESDSVEDYDEDFLLKEDEEIQMEGDSSLKQSLNSNFSSYTSDEPEDDEISLHPDDSMFDEEDEPRLVYFITWLCVFLTTVPCVSQTCLAILVLIRRFVVCHSFGTNLPRRRARRTQVGDKQMAHIVNFKMVISFVCLLPVHL